MQISSKSRSSVGLLCMLGILGVLFDGCGSNSNTIAPVSLRILTQSPLPNAQVGVPYSEMLMASGGSTPYKWALTSGTVPKGLAFDASAGVISGTPSQAINGTNLTFSVTDSSTVPQTQTVMLSFTVSNATPVSIAVTPANPSVTVGKTQQFTATGTYSDNSTQNLTSSVTWASSNISIATINSTGLATAATAGATAISATMGGVVGSTTFTVVSTSSISVSISPKRGGLTVGQTLSVTATVANDPLGQGVTWSATGGSFSLSTTASGAATSYTAAATAGVYAITATSLSDGTKNASVTIGVTDLAGVFTYHNDLSRDGSNMSEYALTGSNVTSATFGKLFSCTVDGAIYAQPLWAANLTVGGFKRNVVFVATQHESLYAFDADVSVTPCVPLWHVSLIDAAHGGSTAESSVPSGIGGLVGAGYGGITPEVGVTGTPVIDPASNTLYVASKSVIASGPTFVQRLHAIDVTTGNERSGSPTTIAATYPGTGDGGTTVTFNPRTQLQRPGLALVNGTVYIAWASHEDTPTYYGWIMGYSASSLSQVSVLNVTPNVGYGGIWMGGGAPAADSSNNIYLLTGNGDFDATNTTGPTNDYGDCFLRLSSSLGVSSYFSPSDQASDNASDQDFGGGGAAVLVDLPIVAGKPNHLVIGGGKDGFLYLLNRDALGGSGDGNAWEKVAFGNGIFSTGAFWNSNFYLAGAGGNLKAYVFDPTARRFNGSPNSQSNISYSFPGTTPSVSSNGTANGIVWALDNSNYCTPPTSTCGPTVLHAYDATNLATELWNSTLGSGNGAGNAVKFTVPTIANGKVYVGTRGNNSGGITSSSTIPGELDVYGLLPN